MSLISKGRGEGLKCWCVFRCSCTDSYILYMVVVIVIITFTQGQWHEVANMFVMIHFERG